jgi:GR25 family glycosyltransferase involved in LPS biosynthesis
MTTSDLKYKSILDKYMNGFDVIYWINLDRSKDRYNNVVKILKNISIKNIRIKAVDGKFDSDDMIYNRINTIQKYRSKIEYACLLSHLDTIREFSKSSYKTALILEDDISMDFVKYWNKSIKDIINNAPKDWEIIMLNYNSDGSIKLNDLYTLNNGDIWCAGAYIINKNSAVKFINNIFKDGKYTLDVNKKHTADNYLFTNLKTYTYKYPYFTYPDNNDSTIHSENLQGHMNSKNRIIKIWEKTKTPETFENVKNKNIYIYIILLIIILVVFYKKIR